MAATYKSDTIPTSRGDLVMTFLGHGSLMMTFEGKTIHIDPYSEAADYTGAPKADLIIITHDHYDHLDPAAYDAVWKDGATTVATKSCEGKVKNCVFLANGEAKTVLGLPIEAVPAYNVLHRRPDGQPFHPKGAGNGYIITFGDKRVYLGGDTENIPEMENLEKIDVAFLPMNLPYTMTPEMVAEAARTFRPKILYPYHYGETDPTRLGELLKDEKDIEVRIRDLR